MTVVEYVGRLKGRSMGGSKTTQPTAGHWECENAKKGPCKGKIFICKMKMEEWRQLLLGSETLPFFEGGF
jgi:hypothetical protein